MFQEHVRTGVNKSWAPGRRGKYISCGGAQFIWSGGTELDECHHSDACNFEVVTRFLDKVFTPMLQSYKLLL